MTANPIVDNAFAGLAGELGISVADFDEGIAMAGTTRQNVVLEAYPSGPVAKAAVASGGQYVGPGAAGGAVGMVKRIERAALEANLEADALLLSPLPVPLKLIAAQEIAQRFFHNAFG